MKKYLSVVMVMALLLTSGVASAESIGVNSHIGHGAAWKASVEQAKDINVSWIRDGKNWTGIMSEDGTFSMPQEFIDYYDNAKKNGIKTMYVLGFGYSGDKYGYSDYFHIPLKSETDYFNDFIKMVEFVATTMKGKVDAYEIWNEPDHTDIFNRGNATAAQYKDLLEASYKAIKKIDPDALVLNGGIAWRTEFLDALLAAGGGDYMDAVAVHKYNHGDAGPEKNFRKGLDSYLSVLNKYNYTKPIWLTENGWYTGSADKAVSRENQGAYLIRNSVIWEDFLKDNNRTGVYMWYDLSDDGINLSSSENNYGLTGYDIHPKPSGKSAKIYNKLVGNMDFVSKTEPQTATYKGGFLNLETIKCYGHLAEYQNTATNEKVYVAWDTNGRSDTKLSVPISGEKVKIYDYQGKLLRSIENPSGTLELTVTDKPQFVSCENSYVEIEDFEYDSQKSIASIKGKAKNLNSVTIDTVYDSNSQLLYSENFDAMTTAEWKENDGYNPWRHWGDCTELTEYSDSNYGNKFSGKALKINSKNNLVFSFDSLGMKLGRKYTVDFDLRQDGVTATKGQWNWQVCLADEGIDSNAAVSLNPDGWQTVGASGGAGNMSASRHVFITFDGNTAKAAVRDNNNNWVSATYALNCDLSGLNKLPNMRISSHNSYPLYLDNLKITEYYEAGNSKSVECDDGKFEAEIDIPREGNLTIYAGKAEIEAIGSTRYAAKAFNAEWEGKKQSNPQTAEIFGVGIVVAENTVSVSGNINGVHDGETLNILAVPKNKELTDYVYMNEINIENGAFSHGFKLNRPGEYTLYLTTTNSASVESAEFGIDGISVADFIIGEENNEVTASASVASHNYDDTKTVLIIAQYDENGVLLSADISERGIPETGVKTFSTSKNVGAKKVHAFIWKSLDEMYPLAESIKL